MKRRIIIAVVMAVMASGVGSAWAHDPGMPDGKRCGEEGRPSRGPGLDRIAERLGLSDAQRKQVAAIVKADRENAEPLMEQLAGYRKELHAAGKGTPFNEAAVRTVAIKLAKVEVELEVSRARVRSQINAILTPEQRALADKLLPPPPEARRPGHRPPPGGWD